jgi:ATP-dependent RNA helicase RhlE
VAEAYVHRIGRTARAGAEGIAISLCAPEDRPLLRAIERLTRQTIPVMGGEPAPAEGPARYRGPPRNGRSGAPPRNGGSRHEGSRHEGHARSEHKPHHRSGAPRDAQLAPRPAAPGGGADQGLGNVSFLRPSGEAQAPRPDQRPHHAGPRPGHHAGQHPGGKQRRPHRGGGDRRNKAG